ncbi:MAG: hypothetical protein AVDCRST_MAG08-3923 [uncultured Acetobacteraceae bacterium]|uniref:Uncharacterized protein n=1 Tax=uncultured Acetobacteraceae bacterium TaxID=169975 RepID=A0A6J4JN62_9PROT|nr:MAG: hypothetical protein AVDCRST_MAG08-3923 [uncultured Acetobacteraceae bacterium]
MSCPLGRPPSRQPRLSRKEPRHDPRPDDRHARRVRVRIRGRPVPRRSSRQSGRKHPSRPARRGGTGHYGDYEGEFEDEFETLVSGEREVLTPESAAALMEVLATQAAESESEYEADQFFPLLAALAPLAAKAVPMLAKSVAPHLVRGVASLGKRLWRSRAQTAGARARHDRPRGGAQRPSTSRGGTAGHGRSWRPVGQRHGAQAGQPQLPTETAAGYERLAADARGRRRLSHRA